jgi:translation initiation factor 3 subunit C
LGIVILKTLAAQFAKKLIVLIESNERAFDASTNGGGLELEGIFCVFCWN